MIKENMGQGSFKKHFKCRNSVKYFTVAWPDSETPIWIFLYNVSTQELFQEKKYETGSF